ncbi:MAG: ABC transporter permease [Sphaerochaetaceae bacterium]|nr:ABC transporter permease [Sphaerochaetaceae bacterium]
MTTYIIRRIIISLLVVFLVSIFSFSLMQIMPGDPARLALGFEASEADVQALREEMNLDKPVIEQYILWIKNIFRGEFGDSVIYKRPVGDMIAERLPRTVNVGVGALCIGIPLGIIFGIVCAVKRGKLADQIITFFMTMVMGMPVFWVGILSILVFAIWLGILPIQGYVAPSKDFGDFLFHAILPILCMFLGMSAGLCRQTRTNLLDSINQDYIRTARANGLSEGSVIYKHALKNALIPVITIIGMQVRVVVGGSLLVEQMFNIPGLGTLLTTALNNRDYMIVQNCTLLISLFTVAANLLVDIAYGFVDPRIRLSRR